MRVGSVLIVSLSVMLLGLSAGAQEPEIVLQWNFDGNLQDSSGNDLNAVAVPAGSEMFGTGVGGLGQALVSDGSNCVWRSGIDTDLLPLKGEDHWSVNVWFYPTEVPQSWEIVWCLGQRPEAQNSRALYSSGSDGHEGITFVGVAQPADGARTPTYISSHVPWDINQWQMLTTTYDGQIVRIYRNGILIAMRAKAFADAPGEVRIPARLHGVGDGRKYMAGKYDRFTVYRGVLRPEQIRELVVQEQLVEVDFFEQAGYYRMDDPDSSTMIMPDHSGQGNDAELFGFTMPLSNWIGQGFRGGALRYDGGAREMELPSWTSGYESVGRAPNHTVSFWFKSGQQPWNAAFYCEYDDPWSSHPWSYHSRLIIRTNNELIQAYNLERDYNWLYNISGDGTEYLDGRTWNHFALVADGEAAQASIYINGKLFAYDEYTRHSHKTPFNVTTMGYNDHHPGYLGQWGDTYIDQVKLYRYALTEEQVQALASKSNFLNNLKVDFEDYTVFADQWKADQAEVTAETFVLDDMEDGIYKWHVHDDGFIDLTDNAYSGDFALRWEYQLPANPGFGNYSTIVHTLDQTTDLSVYEHMTLQMYRHSGNSAENVLYLKFINDAGQVKAEAWIEGSGSTAEPADEWAQWTINLDNLLGEGGAGEPGEKTRDDLTDISYIQIGCGKWDASEHSEGVIDIDDIKFTRQAVCYERVDADLNFDCLVDIADLAIFVEDWLLGTD